MASRTAQQRKHLNALINKLPGNLQRIIAAKHLQIRHDAANALGRGVGLRAEKLLLRVFTWAANRAHTLFANIQRLPAGRVPNSMTGAEFLPREPLVPGYFVAARVVANKQSFVRRVGLTPFVMFLMERRPGHPDIEIAMFYLSVFLSNETHGQAYITTHEGDNDHFSSLGGQKRIQIEDQELSSTQNLAVQVMAAGIRRAIKTFNDQRVFFSRPARGVTQALVRAQAPSSAQRLGIKSARRPLAAQPKGARRPLAAQPKGARRPLVPAQPLNLSYALSTQGIGVPHP
jgi:hypothetical protein